MSDEIHGYTARRYVVLIQDARGFPAPGAPQDPSPPEGALTPMLHSAVLVADLLAPQFVERLWSHLPLVVHCDCEPEWSEDLEEMVVNEDACECRRRSILAVRNCLAAALGDEQISAIDPEAEAYR